MKKKITKRILILLSFFFLPCFAQAQEEIAATASKLSGLWLMERYESDTLVSTQVLKGDRMIKQTYIDDQLTEEEETSGGFALSLYFNSTGKGSYQEHFAYHPASELLDMSSCQPVPELKAEDGKVYMQLINMIGDRTKINIQTLTDDRLVFLFENGAKQVFVRQKQ